MEIEEGEIVPTRFQVKKLVMVSDAEKKVFEALGDDQATIVQVMAAYKALSESSLHVNWGKVHMAIADRYGLNGLIDIKDSLYAGTRSSA